MEKIKYSDLIDYVLYVLWLVTNEGDSRYVSLVSLVRLLGYNMSFSGIQEMGKYLDTRGLAKVIFLLGDVKAQINARGLIYLDDRPAEFSLKFQDIFHNLLQEKGENEEGFKIEALNRNDDPKKEILTLIDEVTTKISEQKGNDSDLVKDLEVIKIELSKSFPDFQLIEIKLNRLGQLDYISSEIQELKDYLVIPVV